MMATQSMLLSGSRGLRASPSLNSDLQAFVLGALLGESHEVAGAVEPHHVLEAAARQLEAVPALAAAQIEDVAVGLDRRRGDDEVDLAARVLDVLDDIAVGLHVQRVEELAPPLFGKMRLEIRDGTEAGARGQAPGTLGLARHHHGGLLSSSLRPSTTGWSYPRICSPGDADPRASQQFPHWPQQNAILSTANFHVKHLSVDDGFLTASSRHGAAALATLSSDCSNAAMKNPSVPCRAGVSSNPCSPGMPTRAARLRRPLPTVDARATPRRRDGSR